MPLPRLTWDSALIRLLVTAVVANALAIGFVHLGDEVSEGETHGFDMAVLQYAQALRVGSPLYTEVLRDLSALGSTVVMTLLTSATCGYLWLVRAQVGALLVAVSIASAALLVGPSRQRSAERGRALRLPNSLRMDSVSRVDMQACRPSSF